MIGITISGRAYAVILSALPVASRDGDGIAPARDYRIWLPQPVVERLIAQREPGETFSDAILRLEELGSLSTLIR